MHVQALQSTLVSLGVLGGGPAQAELVFVRANTNGDARVSREELVAAVYVRPTIDTFCHSDPMTVPDVFPGECIGMGLQHNLRTNRHGGGSLPSNGSSSMTCACARVNACLCPADKLKYPTLLLSAATPVPCHPH